MAARINYQMNILKVREHEHPEKLISRNFRMDSIAEIQE